MSTWLLLISMMVIAGSGLPGLLLDRRGRLGQWIAAALNVIGSMVGGAGVIVHWWYPQLSHPIDAAWTLPVGRFALAADDLSLIFLVPIFLISALGSIYGLSYWNQRRHVSNGRKLRACWGLLAGAMAMVVLARDGVLFLMAWEVMALSAFFLVATEETRPAARESAWVFLAAAHAGTLCLFGFFALLRQVTGTFSLWPAAPAAIAPGLATALFVLGAIGFGLKAGIMPLHVWLPGGHANAPSHVSAMLSGVMLNLGVYGMVRVAALMAHPPAWWGATFIVAGAVSALFGIACAVGQADLKRLLAYSSIENMGIVVLGLGLATLGRSLDRPDLIVLGLGGALLHVLNHSLFKPLLFMGAGGIVHATRTREMDRLGGLGQRMPRSFVLFAIGAIAIAGLPPLNGFVSELLLAWGFLRTASAAPAGWGWTALAAPALALVGALAVGGFVKVLGTVFSGAARSRHAEHAHDPDRAMLAPMCVLAGCCILIGVWPGLMIGILDRAIASWTSRPVQAVGSLGSYVPMRWLTAMAAALIGSIGLVGAWFFRWPGVRAVRSAGTWDCGYARPTPRMQYTGSSFSQMLVALFAWAIWPREKTPRIRAVFAGPAKFSSEVPDPVLDRGLLPAFEWAPRFLGWARVFQRGPIQVYLLYVLGILIALLLFV